MRVRASGMRSSHGLSLGTMLILSVLFFVSTASAASAVLGIDLGTNFIKAAIVKPGTPLDIVLTKDSKRKEASVVAFKPARKGPVELGSFPERLYGGDALALAGRFPDDVYSNLKPLVGIAPGDTSVVDEYSSRFPALKVSKDKTTLAFKSGAFSGQEQPWSVEELLAMELKNIRTNAQALTGKGSKVTDAVITIPAFYTADERLAVLRAADLAGLSVMALISDGVAVGIDYSVKRDFPNVSRGGKAELHLVYDMGATSTTATVLRFQTRDVKDFGKFNKTIHEVAVLGTGWDRSLGGNSLNGLVLDHLVSDFMAKPQVKTAGFSAADVKSHGRTASKLWRESERARQVLSANSEVRSSFEGLYEDIDSSSTLSRTQFEELATPFADRVDLPIKQALEAAKISLSDLESIILHGGAVRTPFVQKRLEALVGKSTEIRSNVNADESAAFGAAFKAAGLSPSFRVKEIRDSEAAVYAAGYIQTQSGKDRQQQIFIPTSLSGTPKQIQVKDKTDFSFDIYQKVNDVDHLIETIQTTNLTGGVKALHDNHGCAADDVTTKFSIRLSPYDGLPEVVSGSVSCVVDTSAKKGGLVDSVKGLFGGKKGEQEPLKDDALSSSSESSSSASSSSSAAASSSTGSASSNKTDTAKKDSKPTTKTEIINIAFTRTPKGLPAPTKEEADRMIERLAAFDRSDKARVRREELFNSLEGITYRVRDLLTDTSFIEASTEAVRSELSAALTATSEWLYSEGSDATSTVLSEKLEVFEKLLMPVHKRIEAAKVLPGMISKLEDALNRTNTFVGVMKDQIASAAASASSAASEAASSVTSAVLPESSKSGDALDDLEEPDTSSSTSSSAKALPTAIFSGYTEEDVTDMSAAYETAMEWLKDKLAIQKKLKPYEDSPFDPEDLSSRVKSLEQAMMSLIRRRATIPKKSTSSAKKAASSKTKSAKSAASSAASSASSAASDAASKATDKAKDAMEDLPLPEGFKVPGMEGKDWSKEDLESLASSLAAKVTGAAEKAEKDPHDEL